MRVETEVELGGGTLARVSAVVEVVAGEYLCLPQTMRIEEADVGLSEATDLLLERLERDERRAQVTVAELLVDARRQQDMAEEVANG